MIRTVTLVPFLLALPAAVPSLPAQPGQLKTLQELVAEMKAKEKAAT